MAAFVVAVILQVEAADEKAALELAQGIVEVGSEGAEQGVTEVVAVVVPPAYLEQARAIVRARH